MTSATAVIIASLLKLERIERLTKEDQGLSEAKRMWRLSRNAIGELKERDERFIARGRQQLSYDEAVARDIVLSREEKARRHLSDVFDREVRSHIFRAETLLEHRRNRTVLIREEQRQRWILHEQRCLNLENVERTVVERSEDEARQWILGPAFAADFALVLLSELEARHRLEVETASSHDCSLLLQPTSDYLRRMYDEYCAAVDGLQASAHAAAEHTADKESVEWRLLLTQVLTGFHLVITGRVADEENQERAFLKNHQDIVSEEQRIRHNYAKAFDGTYDELLAKELLHRTRILREKHLLSQAEERTSYHEDEAVARGEIVVTEALAFDESFVVPREAFFVLRRTIVAQEEAAARQGLSNIENVMHITAFEEHHRRLFVCHMEDYQRTCSTRLFREETSELLCRRRVEELAEVARLCELIEPFERLRLLHHKDMARAQLKLTTVTFAMHTLPFEETKARLLSDEEAMRVRWMLKQNHDFVTSFTMEEETALRDCIEQTYEPLSRSIIAIEMIDVVTLRQTVERQEEQEWVSVVEWMHRHNLQTTCDGELLLMVARGHANRVCVEERDARRHLLLRRVDQLDEASHRMSISSESDRWFQQLQTTWMNEKRMGLHALIRDQAMRRRKLCVLENNQRLDLHRLLFGLPSSSLSFSPAPPFLLSPNDVNGSPAYNYFASVLTTTGAGKEESMTSVALRHGSSGSRGQQGTPVVDKRLDEELGATIGDDEAPPRRDEGNSASVNRERQIPFDSLMDRSSHHHPPAVAQRSDIVFATTNEVKTPLAPSPPSSRPYTARTPNTARKLQWEQNASNHLQLGRNHAAPPDSPRQVPSGPRSILPLTLSSRVPW